MKIRIKIQGALMFLGLIAVVSLSELAFPHWKYETMDESLDILGAGIVLFGFLFRIAARGHKEKESRNGNALVKNGPYAIVRNPMYFGTLMIGTGMVIMLLRLWTFFIFAAIFLLIYLPQIKREEKMLSMRFGNEYEEYRALTPKYFPRFHHIVKLKSFISLEFSWIKREMLSLIGALAVIMTVEIWEDVKLFGHRELAGELLELSAVFLLFIFIGSLFFKKEARSA